MTQINDRSAPILESEYPPVVPHTGNVLCTSGWALSPQLCSHHWLLVGGADCTKYNPCASILPEPKGSGGSSYGSSSAAIQPKGGLFQGGVPKLRPVGAKDGSGKGPQDVVSEGRSPSRKGLRICRVCVGHSAVSSRDPKLPPTCGRRRAASSAPQRPQRTALLTALRALLNASHCYFLWQPAFQQGGRR